MQAVFEISQPIWRKSCLNRGVFSEVGCGLFRWEPNEPEFWWLDLILSLLICSIKFTQRSELREGGSARQSCIDLSFRTKETLPGRDLHTRESMFSSLQSFVNFFRGIMYEGCSIYRISVRILKLCNLLLKME